MSRSLLIFGGLVLAFWPVGAWCFRHLAPLSDRLCGLAAMGTVAAFLCWRGSESPECNDVGPEGKRTPSLAPITILILVEAVLVPWMPPLLGVLAAVVILAAALSVWRYATPLHLGTCGLLLLSLPVLSRLQFYLGYPLRVASGSLAAAMLRSGGFDVAREGTVLNWRGDLIAIDAPCSGTKMLWAGAYLACVLICFHRFSARQSVLTMAVAGIAIALGNALRISALFHLQTTLAEWPSWWHDAVGLLCFALAGLAIVASTRVIAGFWKIPSATVGNALRGVPGSALDAAMPPLGTPRSAFPTANVSKRAMICYLAACLLAAAAPLMAMGPKLVGSAASVPVWPTQFRGRPLQPVGLKDYERRFAETLPGHLAKFTDGTRQYMFQWVSASNHLLHSATDCMASAGFTIAPQPLWVDEEGNRWSCALARRGPNSVRVYERIVDAAGHDWQDVSAWYWATLLGKTHTPWWMITILESIADEAREQTRSDPAKPADQSSPLGSTVLRNRREVPRPMDGCDNPDDLFQNSSLIDSMSQSSISPQSAASSPFLTSRSI